MTALVGPSGAGKTTICRMVAGLHRPRWGRVVCGGIVWCDTEKGAWLPVQKRGVGFVFQDYPLFPHMTLWQNITVAARNRESAERLAELVGIGDLLHLRPFQVSGGQRQRAALAQALARDPSLLILDEPFSALDLAIRLELRALVREIKECFQVPILLVTHDILEAELVADEIIPLCRGRVCHQWLHEMKVLVHRIHSAANP